MKDRRIVYLALVMMSIAILVAEQELRKAKEEYEEGEDEVWKLN